MKKVVLIAGWLILTLLFAKTALGKFTDSSDILTLSSSNDVDVRIVEKTFDYPCRGIYSHETLEEVSVINESLDNLAPGHEVFLSYKIVSGGSIDVMLEGVNITFDNSELSNFLTFDWSLTHYENDKPVNTISGSVCGSYASNESVVSSAEIPPIILRRSNSDNNYCILKITAILTDDESVLSSKSRSAVFRISPSFRQY